MWTRLLSAVIQDYWFRIFIVLMLLSGQLSEGCRKGCLTLKAILICSCFKKVRFSYSSWQQYYFMLCLKIPFPALPSTSVWLQVKLNVIVEGLSSLRGDPNAFPGYCSDPLGLQKPGFHHPIAFLPIIRLSHFAGGSTESQRSIYQKHRLAFKQMSLKKPLHK